MFGPRLVNPAREAGMYLGVEKGSQVRHVSLVPFFDGLESLCGRVLASTQYGSPRMIAQHANCGGCRALVGGWAPQSQSPDGHL